MNGLSIRFSIPEVITGLSRLFLLGTSHATAACFPVCGDVYLAERFHSAWLWVDLFTLLPHL